MSASSGRLLAAESEADTAHDQMPNGRIDRAVVGLAREVGRARRGNAAGAELDLGTEAPQDIGDAIAIDVAPRRAQADAQRRIDREAVVAAVEAGAARCTRLAARQRLRPAIEGDAGVEVEEQRHGLG